MNNKINTRRHRMGGPGGGPHGMMPGEKAKDFKGTLAKTFRYMRRDVVTIVIAFVLAISSVILTLTVPDILGTATDELLGGAMQKTYYNAAIGFQETLDKMPDDIPTGAENMTVADLIDRGIVPADDVDESMLGVTVAQLYAAKDATTVGEFFTALGMQDEFSVAESYRDRVLGTSLTDAAPGIDSGKIIDILVKIIILVATSAIVGYIQGFLLAGVAQRVSYRFRDDINRKIDKLPLKFFDTTTNGEVMSFITNDVDAISTALNQSLSQSVTAVTTIVGVLVMMFKISWVLTLVALVMVPVSLVIVMLIVKRSQKFYLMQQEYLGHVNGHIEETFAGHNVVSLFNGEERTLEEFKAFNDKLYISARNSQFFSGMMMPLMGFVGNLNYVICCVLGGVMVINGFGGLTVGNIQSFIQYFRQFNQPINQMSSIANTFQSTVAAAERIFGFLEQPEEEETGSLAPEDVKGEVSFEHVKFGYDPEKIIIHDFSCDVKPGQRVAIVGPTGAGKTTIVKLLMRFYELGGGSISLDGADITEYTREALREHIGMVLQDTWLFSGTIRDNIRYGKLNATDEEVERAAKIACADHFIRTLPEGYDFVINSDADNISQGQKQLLTIARAVLADPKVLILDEATSSVDTRTEVLIQQAMDALMQGRTSFIIAHRLSTIKNADRILVLRDGDVVEQGSHEELLVRNGFYASLYNSQFEG